MFRDRLHAAQRLAKALDQYRGRNPLILAIPRGAVPMGYAVAEALGGDLDVILVRKLRAPGNPELAAGAVGESGWTYLADHAAAVGADEAYLERELRAQRENLRERRARYTPERAPIDPRGRIAIVVDDGMATGSSMIAALHDVRARQPQRLVCAVPVAAAESLEKVAASADEVVCLERPTIFYAVGEFYQSFPQVEDAEVIDLLARARTLATAAATPHS